VLSCGHASILLYVQLFLTGYDLSLDDLRTFRQLNSRTPGHPEFGHTPGVETTTGPLGQGLATAIGMAMAIKHEKALRDPGATTSPFDRTVWVLCSDGDLQEGLSYEASALAGRHQLDNLVVIYDDNNIQIEGSTALTSSEDTALRFTAQNWNVLHVGLGADGDIETTTLNAAMAAGRAEQGRPTIIIVKSQIAWPAPNARNTAAAHGSPLGAPEIAATRTVLKVTTEPFTVTDDVLTHTRQARERGEKIRTEWEHDFSVWSAANPALAADKARAAQGDLPSGLRSMLPTFTAGKSVSTRDASGETIQVISHYLSELWGGSADLAEPNRTAIDGGNSFLPEETATAGRAGRNIHWGVREGAMASAMNGISLIGGFRFFAGTFLTFSDYQRPAIRLAALMQRPVTFVWTHDSVALGADGPTHQPIEHLASLRAIPGFSVVRPADAAETSAAWLAILENNAPAGLILGRQPVLVSDTPMDLVCDGVKRGAYVVRDAEDIDVVVIATGSEVELAHSAAAELQARPNPIHVRVVSMPCREWFDRQNSHYRDSVIPPSLRARVVVEAGSSFGWRDISGPTGEVVAIDQFGLSAPADDALAARGITVTRVIEAIERTLSNCGAMSAQT